MRPGVVRPLGDDVAPERDFIPIDLIAAGGQPGESDDERKEDDDAPTPEQPMQPRHAEPDHRHERQVHAVLGHGLRNQRHHTRTRRQNRKEPRADQAQHRPAPQSEQRRRHQQPQRQTLRHHVGHAACQVLAVVENQRTRPERQP